MRKVICISCALVGALCCSFLNRFFGVAPFWLGALFGGAFGALAGTILAVVEEKFQAAFEASAEKRRTLGSALIALCSAVFAGAILGPAMAVFNALLSMGIFGADADSSSFTALSALFGGALGVYFGALFGGCVVSCMLAERYGFLIRIASAAFFGGAVPGLLAWGFARLTYSEEFVKFEDAMIFFCTLAVPSAIFCALIPLFIAKGELRDGDGTDEE